MGAVVLGDLIEAHSLRVIRTNDGPALSFVNNNFYLEMTD